MKNTDTHWACNARIEKEGGKARCCDCVPHKNCPDNTTKAEVDYNPNYYNTGTNQRR